MHLRSLIPPLRLTLRHPWVPNVRFRLNARRHVTYLRHGLAGYEPHVARALLREVRPEWFVVEIGTHIGFFTTLLAARAKHVLAFEPDARNRAGLLENLTLNGIANVEIVGAACGDREGEFSFVTDPDSGSAGGLAASHHGEHAGPKIQVPVHRLDEFLAARALAPPDLVKIDAEGAEDAVLEGMGRLLDGSTRVLVEVNEASKGPVHDRLRAHGYRLLNPHMGMAEQPPGGYAGWHVYAVRP